jgi:thioredoxin reductase
VTLVYRSGDFQSATGENVKKLQDLAAQGKLQILMNTKPVRVEPGKVVVAGGDKKEVSLEANAIYCMLGSVPHTAWFKSMGVKLEPKPQDWNPGRTDQLPPE